MEHNFEIMFTILLVCVLLTVASCPVDAANDGQIRFSNLSIDDGLSQNTVFSICQDAEGYIWFATLEGLNRFDGNSFTVFLHDENEPGSLPDNIIHILFLDSQGVLWIGTESSLVRWNRRMERFDNFAAGSPVMSLAEVSAQKFLVGTEKGLRCFDAEKDCFTDNLPENTARLRVKSMTRHSDSIYIGSVGEGLFVYSISGGEMIRVPAYSGNSTIQTIFVQNGNLVWFGTEGDGLFCLNLEEGGLRNFRAGVPSGGIGSNFVRSIASDTNGRIWVGTFNSLDIYDSATDTFECYRSDPFREGTISRNSVRCILRDNQGGMWLGTYFGGVDYWHPLRSRFENIRQTPGANSLNDDIVNCITPAPDGVLWIGTNNGGLNSYDPATGRFHNFGTHPANRADGLESNDIKAIHIDSATSDIYIGAHAGGLCVLPAHSGTIRQCKFNGETGIAPLDIYSIIEESPGLLWIGSLQGLFSYRTSNGELRNYPTSGEDRDNLRIRALMKDSRGWLWIGGENDMEIRQMNDGRLLQVNPGCDELSGLSFILGFHESSSGIVWIATRNGLFAYSPKENTLKRYTVASGLPSNVINGIEEDSYGRLWLSTDNGLSCLNPYSGVFRNFTVKDGLPSRQFSMGSHCRLDSGRMYFGGIRGITTFIPERVTDNPYSPAPILSGFRVFNDRVIPGDDSGILEESVASTERITLGHDCNSFSVDFTVNDFIAGGHSTFSWRLVGFEENWTAPSSSRTASYSNLPPGKYRFEVASANNDGKWNTDPTVLEIWIRPAWHQLFWVRALLVLAGLALVVWSVWFYIGKKSVQNRLELEKKDREHQEEISQMKMRFFINISHELRSPLMLILNPVQEMLDRVSDIWTRKQLRYVQRNAQRLLHLVNQLMDYRRAELGVFKLSVKPEDINRIVRENFSYYETLASSKKLKYSLISHIPEKTEVLVDGQYIELILNNLLSNAFKYTDKGSITVTERLSEGRFILEVADTGAGIPLDRQDKIFERFYQLENSHIGSGIGLSLVQRLVELHHATLELESEEGKGARFIVSIPQERSAYSPDELSAGTDDAPHTTNSREMYVLDSQETHEETQGTQTVPDGSRPKILVVEDEEDIRAYMETSLSSSFQIRCAPDGARALEMVGEDCPDMVITDMMMPVMDGMKLCARLKQDSSTSHIPVIMLSAKADGQDQLKALNSGADDFLTKPFSMTMLKAKIRNMLRTRMIIEDKATRSTSFSPEKAALNAMDEEIVRKAVSIVERNMDNVEFSTDEFARQMNMSRSNLHLKLKSITGDSALGFIYKVRFSEACRLLEDGRYSVSEISDMVGFNTPSYFATCFKKHIGCLPTEWAKQN